VTHTRFRFIFASHVIEADVHRLRQSEVNKLPGERSEYSFVKVGRGLAACKITGLAEILNSRLPAQRGKSS
jgi:hypothetical protein